MMTILKRMMVTVALIFNVDSFLGGEVWLGSLFPGVCC